MAITIDYLDPAEFVINIPRLDMVDVTGGSPTEIRQLNIDSFRSTLGDLQDDAAGQWAVTAFEHTAPLTVAGVTLARVVEILDPYVILFEDGAYNVNIVGGNSNISDVTIKNQVGINTANSAGLQDPFALQAAAFGGRVAIDVTSIFSGTSFPIGTRSNPVNNVADAIAIAELRGYREIIILSDMTMSSGDFSDGYAFYGDSPVVLMLTLDPATNVTNCSFNNMSIQGTLDGMNTLIGCHTFTMSFFNGAMHNCAIEDVITLGGGVQADIIDCFSGVAGGGPGQTPTIDMGGSGNNMIMRNFSGGMLFTNATGAMDASMDYSSGRAIFDSTIAAGAFTVRGNCTVTDSSTGTAVITDLTVNAATEAAEYDGRVVLSSSGGSGTNYPYGTGRQPVDNLTDALSIANTRGIKALRFLTSWTILSGEDVSFKIIEGLPSQVAITVNSGAISTGTSFVNCVLDGTLSGTNSIEDCHTGIINNFNGSMYNCAIASTITLGGGAQADLYNCFSDVAGGGAGQTPTINMGGSGSDMILRNYSGGMTFTNATGALDCSVDFLSGRAIFESSIAAGSFTVRGNCVVADSSTGTAVVTDLTINAANEAAEYDGIVTISSSGSSGTTYPVGTARSPVDNITDANLIADSRGINELHFIDDWTVASGEDVSGKTIIGLPRLTITFAAGSIAALNTFKNIDIVGTIISPRFFDNVEFNNVNIDGTGILIEIAMRDCVFRGTLTLETILQANIEITNCTTGVSDVAIFDMNGSNSNIGFNNYSGIMEIKGLSTAGKTVEADFITGDLLLDASNTDGSITVRGDVTVTDNSAGTVVFDDSSHQYFHLIEKLLRNKTITDPTTGIITVYEEDGTTPYLTAQLYEDTAGAQTYQGDGIERRERLE